LSTLDTILTSSSNSSMAGLLEAWQPLEEPHTDLRGMQGYAGPDAKALLNVADERAVLCEIAQAYHGHARYG